ncbi:MAG: hypothetical protein KKE83_06880 [Proteobacteria bacterium]|nr:hypothetical protein [Pseudomonadota bacterium]
MFKQIKKNYERAKELSFDNWMKIIGISLSLLTVWIGIYQYRDAKEKEYKMVFYEKRFQIYMDLADTIAKIATLPEGQKERADAVQRFWQLIYGQAVLVSDKNVDEAIRKASNWVVFCVEKKGPPPEDNMCVDIAGNAHALAIAKSARNSVTQVWNIPLEKLNEKNLYSRN